VDDGDDTSWTQHNTRTGELDILRVDRFYHFLWRQKQESCKSLGLQGYASQYMEQSKTKKVSVSCFHVVAIYLDLFSVI
jgi:hypothetical protein